MNKSLKKMLLLAMIFMILGGIRPGIVKAAESKEWNLAVEETTNPLFPELEESNSLEAQAEEEDAIVKEKSSNYFYSKQSAAEYVRNQMVNRNETFSFTIYTSYYSSLGSDILDLAVAYSDDLNPWEGDYLLSHYTRARFSGSYSTYYNYVNYTFTISYSTSAYQEYLVDQKLEEVLDSLDVYDKDDYTKIKAVHDWITTNVEYDYTYSRYSTYHALISNRVVCQGFASLTYRMLKELNVGVRYITGIGNGGNHGWNIVKIGDVWYNVDNTWDENTSTGSSLSYMFFLKNEYDFDDHTRDYEYRTYSFNREYPMASSSYVAISSVKLNKTSLGLALGGTEKLTVSINPSNATNKKVTWTSSNPEIATVDKTGKVTMVSSGTATITATTGEGGYKVTCKVKKIIPVTKLTLNKASLTIKKGAKASLTSTIAPSDASEKGVTYKSSNTKVVKVDNSGAVTAVGGGTATITATSKQGNKTATCKVAVTASVTGVKLNKTSVTVGKGSKVTIKATINPSDATNKDVTFTSKDKKIATVGKNGVIKGVKTGSTTITVTTKDGKKTATCSVKVVIPVKSISLNQKSVTLLKGKAIRLKATIAPSNATEKGVTYKSSNTKVAKVDSTGKVTAVGAGSATITAQSKDGKKKATCKVKVTIAVKSVKLNKTSVTISKGNSIKLKATINPTNATNKNVTFTSKNTKIAKVDKNGKVTGVSKGTTTITVKTKDGSKKATCKVTVKDDSVDAISAYESYVKKYRYTKYKKDDGLGIYSYAYLDIDQNGVKELIVSREYEYTIFTYKNGKMKKVESLYDVYDNWFFRYNKTDKTIVAGNGDAGGPSINIYSMINDSIVCTNSEYSIDTYDWFTNGVLPESEWKYYSGYYRLYGSALSECKRAISGTEISFKAVK